MNLSRVEQAEWLSNAYLVVDRPAGSGVLVDSNGVVEPLLEAVERDGTTITHILLTHAHPDHVVGIREIAERLGGAPVLIDADAATDLDFEPDETVKDGDKTTSGDLEIEWVFTPGHAPGHHALVINGTDVITADVLFKGTVGGTAGPRAGGFEDLRNSVMERLMKLPPETRVHPGHKEPTTISAEWETNPFVRVWRGLDDEGSEDCTVWDREATLVVWGPDYDGGNKAWVRFGDSGENTIVGGSQVRR